MGEQFENIIDVTLAYPENTDKPFKDMLMGRMTKIVVHVKVLPVDEQVLGITSTTSRTSANSSNG